MISDRKCAVVRKNGLLDEVPYKVNSSKVADAFIINYKKYGNVPSIYHLLVKLMK